MKNSQKRFFYFLWAELYGKCDITVNNKAVNQGDGDGLQLPCNVRLSGQNSIVEILKHEVLCKKAFLRNFVKVTGKHLCQGPFFNKVAGLRAATILEYSWDSGTGVFLRILRKL